MKYKKGSFIVIPNKEYLKGKPSELQAIYVWICEHSNDDGICYPTRRKIAQEAGCGIKTVDKYCKQMVEDGILEIILRKKEGTNEFTSSLYQVMIKTTPSCVQKDATPSVVKGNKTNPYSNEPNLNGLGVVKTTPISPEKKKTKKQLRLETPFSFEVEMNVLATSHWKGHKIIHNYFRFKGFRFENYAQFDTAVGKELTSAKDLQGYSAQQLLDTMNYCQENYSQFNWSLNTIVKTIANIVNKNG